MNMPVRVRARISPRALLAVLLIAVGLATLARAGCNYVQEALTQAHLTEQLRLAQQRAPRGAIDAGVARPVSAPFPWYLSVPRVGVAVAVVNGADDGTLRTAAGRIPGTGLPGRPGTIGIAAHRDTFFRGLRHVAIGDRILVETADRDFEYRVVSTTIVKPEDTWVLRSHADEALVLVTCYPFAYIGRAPQRFVVRAARIPAPTRGAAARP